MCKTGLNSGKEKETNIERFCQKKTKKYMKKTVKQNWEGKFSSFHSLQSYHKARVSEVVQS